MSMTDLSFVMPHLGPGGAQRVAVLAAEHFASQGLRVSIITLLPGKPLAHRLPEGVQVIDLGPEGGDKGGKIIATGPPEKIAKAAKSYTGHFLKAKI